MTLEKILTDGYNGYDYKEFKNIVEFLKELKPDEIEEKDYERVANTLAILLQDETYLKKETIEKLDNLLNYVRGEE